VANKASDKSACICPSEQGQNSQGVQEGVVKINNQETTAKAFAYDGCHKIYLLERDLDWKNASGDGYTILPIEKLVETYDGSCDLRFISNWALTKKFVRQFELATFDEVLA
jgi:hypothetical protein